MNEDTFAKEPMELDSHNTEPFSTVLAWLQELDENILQENSWINHSYISGVKLRLKGTHDRRLVKEFRRDITQDRVLYNIPTKAFCPPMCILFVCS